MQLNGVRIQTTLLDPGFQLYNLCFLRLLSCISLSTSFTCLLNFRHLMSPKIHTQLRMCSPPSPGICPEHQPGSHDLSFALHPSCWALLPLPRVWFLFTPLPLLLGFHGAKAKPHSLQKQNLYLLVCALYVTSAVTDQTLTRAQSPHAAPSSITYR